MSMCQCGGQIAGREGCAQNSGKEEKKVKGKETGGPYDDIINLPHHQSKTHPHMPLHDRAAQFAPFAALTGYDDMVRETGRLTEAETDLSEDDREVLDRRISMIISALADGQHPSVTITCFVPDGKKDGGSYVSVSGQVKKIDIAARLLILLSENGISAGDAISIDRIIDITGE